MDDRRPAPGQWAGSVLYHGCSINDSDSILSTGVDIEKSAGGYFGWGFYIAYDGALALSNYADMSDDGVVLACVLSSEARILDLRIPADAELWNKISNFGQAVSDPSFWRRALSAGIDGVYDNSFEGVCIYNSAAIAEISLHEASHLKERPR